MSADGSTTLASWWDVGIATIFAREILEACIIIGQYRTVIQHSDLDDEGKRKSLKMVWVSAGAALALAVVIILAVAIPIIVSRDSIDGKAVEYAEGVSKVVAAICIAILSLKVPKWLGVLPGVKSSKAKNAADLTLRSLAFNVGWNILREILEIGIFLIPYFIASNNAAVAIPGSGAIGLLIGLVVGAIVYVINKFTTQQLALAISMSFITGWLSTGLFTGGCHEFEEASTETPKVFRMPGDSVTGFWSHKKLPMALFKPFGYSYSPTVLMLCCFWLWAAGLCLLHALKIWKAKKNAANKQAEVNARVSTDLKADQLTAVVV